MHMCEGWFLLNHNAKYLLFVLMPVCVVAIQTRYELFRSCNDTNVMINECIENQMRSGRTCSFDLELYCQNFKMQFQWLLISLNKLRIFFRLVFRIFFSILLWLSMQKIQQKSQIFRYLEIGLPLMGGRVIWGFPLIRVSVIGRFDCSKFIEYAMDITRWRIVFECIQ